MTTKAEVLALDVVGIGFPLVDVLALAEEELLGELDLVKGSMTLIDHARAERIYAAMGPGTEVSGGSAANTMAGIAALGGTAGFIGRIADDELGRIFTHDIRSTGVVFEPVMLADDGEDTIETTTTGRCHVLSTADAERTMATFLGAGSLLTPAHVDPAFVARGQLCYLEGYQWDLEPAKAAMRKAIAAAHDAGGIVALTLSDSFCVERHQADWLQLAEGDLDVIFANEDEIMALFSSDTFEHALDAVEETGVLAAITTGPAGAIVVTPNGRITVPAMEAQRIETTGAGDLFASGFCYGLTHGFDPESAARLGNLCAAEIISHMGARPVADLAELAAEAGLL